MCLEKQYPLPVKPHVSTGWKWMVYQLDGKYRSPLRVSWRAKSVSLGELVNEKEFRDSIDPISLHCENPPFEPYPTGWHISLTRAGARRFRRECKKSLDISCWHIGERLVLTRVSFEEVVAWGEQYGHRVVVTRLMKVLGRTR